MTSITTNQGREFMYSQIYIIRTGQIENETIVWDREKEVEVGEKAVMEGKHQGLKKAVDHQTPT